MHCCLYRYYSTRYPVSCEALCEVQYAYACFTPCHRCRKINTFSLRHTDTPSGRTCPASQPQRLLARSISQPLTATPSRTFSSSGSTSTTSTTTTYISDTRRGSSSNSSSGATKAPSDSTPSPVKEPSGRPVHHGEDELHVSGGGVDEESVQGKGNDGGVGAAAAAAAAGTGG
ncbi:unnamed protein product, partial [Laminaria digitata]